VGCFPRSAESFQAKMTEDTKKSLDMRLTANKINLYISA